MINTWPGWKNVKSLGKGSYGSVYEIEKEEFGKVYKAALKVISVPADKDEYQSVVALDMDEASTINYFYNIVENITKEIIVLNTLKGYTNIVSYEDHLIQKRKDGFGWDILIRMELLVSLNDYRAKHPMDEKEVCKLGIDICKALELCKQENILHRDIKPANIFVNKTGDYKLGDFGIARNIDRTKGTFSKKGTYNYMAPEVYQGKKYGYTADIYSLGIVLYRLLNNNRLPFLKNQVTLKLEEEALSKRMRGEKIPPLQIDKRLSNIIQKCIEYNPDNRYQSAEELRKDLVMYLKNKDKKEDSEIQDISNEETLYYEKKNIKVQKKSKLPIILVVIVALLLTSVAGYVFYISRSKKESAPIEETEVVEEKMENEETSPFETVTFGTYNGQEIEWIVLDEKEDGSKLLLSKYLFINKKYNERHEEVTWETCSLRSWLNNDFYQESFSSSEQTKIQTTKVINKDNEINETEGGSDTEDKIFVLSAEEANQYFYSNEERIVTRLDNKDSGVYWLRSPGSDHTYAGIVYYSGWVDESGFSVDDTSIFVRPTLWIHS